MNHKQEVLKLLNQVKNGEITPEMAFQDLRTEPFEDLGYAKVDYHRSLRQGTSEVIFGQNKTPEQIRGILEAMGQKECKNILVTRINGEVAGYLQKHLELDYHQDSRLGIAYPETVPGVGKVVVITGGTSDMPVAEEAAVTAEVLGNEVVRIYDAGVAGLHRLLANLEPLMSARVVVAVAGMEGALASVVGGLVDCPVIAVPTSVGYGASFGGVAALLSMLNSCASGVSVVNIDNGFGAGFLASRINQMEGIN